MKIEATNSGLFQARCNTADNFIFRINGWAWNKYERCWETPYSHSLNKLGYALTPLLRAALQNVEKREKISLLQSKAVWSDFEVPIPEGLELFPFQKAGIEYMSKRSNTLLADEMGIGKTIQVLGYLNFIKPRRVLIICPATLKNNWFSEWKKWSTLDWNPMVIERDMKCSSNIAIVNYDRLHKCPWVYESGWDVLICDESHYLKNPKALRTKQVVGKDKVKPIEADIKLFLTGTPILNRPVELFTSLRYLNPPGWPNYMEYVKRYCAAEAGQWGWDVNGASNLEELQDKLRSSIMLRRLKKDVLPQLPPKFRQIIEISPDATARAALRKERELFGVEGTGDLLSQEEYTRIINTMDSGKLPFEEISRIRKETALSKLPQALEHIKDIVEQNPKTVVFAHHHAVIDAVMQEFGELAVSITGKVPTEKRIGIVRQFQEDSNVRIFVGQITAAGTGITLTAANIGIFLELPWTPGETTQAEDRLHRIGQTGNVVIQHVVLAGSLDAKMAQTIIRKQEIIEKAVDSGVSEADLFS